MHKPETFLEKETHKILSDFEIQADHLIPATRNLLLNGFWHSVKTTEQK